MVFLPLLLIWMRDPMYFPASCRWAVVLLAISSGLLDPQTMSHPTSGTATTASAAESSDPRAAGDADRLMSESADRLAIDQPVRPALEQEHRRAWDRQAIPPHARLREGTRIAPTVGRFTLVDGVWIFESESQDPNSAAAQADAADRSSVTKGLQIRVLENLTLQRVAQTVQQDPADNRWMINGVITEYFGENRLMITTAIRANASSPRH